MKLIYGQKISRIIRYCAVTFYCALEFMIKDELSPTYVKFLCDLPSVVMTK